MEHVRMKERVSFSWDIHYACNYRCPYCWFCGQWHNLVKLNRYLSVEELMKYWKNIHEKYGDTYINILGGEPFIYPHFIDLIKKLSELHTIQITTNLSVDMENFVKNIDPQRVKISSSFHPLFAKYDIFIKKALLLRENGFGDSILYLAYPPQINQINFYKEIFKKNDLHLSVLPFWGEYNNKKYPQDYTESERGFLEPFLGECGGEKFQLSPKKVKGRLCKAGQTYALILADGTVTRCGNVYLNEKIGNFFDITFKLFSESLPCNSEFCRCNEGSALILSEKNDEDKNEDLKKKESLIFPRKSGHNEELVVA